jgi:hypothetical protein
VLLSFTSFTPVRGSAPIVRLIARTVRAVFSHPLTGLALLVVALSLAPSASAQNPPNKCDSAKLDCMRKKANCLLKVHRKAIKKGELPDAEKLDTCKAKFDDPVKGCVARAEAKQNFAKPNTVCTVVGNTASMETIVDDFVDQALIGIVTGGVPNPTPTATPGGGEATPTTTNTPAAATCGDPPNSYPACGGSCPNAGTCLADEFVTESCLCTLSECDLLINPVTGVGACVGSCAITGGSCACSAGSCVGGGCILPQDCPAGQLCVSGFCTAGACATDADCVAGTACLCNSSCACQ